jgi:hypothetical protein
MSLRIKKIKFKINKNILIKLNKNIIFLDNFI